MVVFHGGAALFLESFLRKGLQSIDGAPIWVSPRLELTLQYAFAKAEAVRAIRGVPLRGAVAVADVPDERLIAAPSDYGRCRIPETGGGETLMYEVIGGPVAVDRVLGIGFTLADGTEPPPVIQRAPGDTRDLTPEEIERIYALDLRAHIKGALRLG